MASRTLWTKEKIKEAFMRFIQEAGRLPKATEIDTLSYLPSSRYIQIRFGGLEKLRKELGFEDAHFGKGLYRSAIAKAVNTRGRASEIDLEQLLRKKFGEVFVHTERIFGDGKSRVDFYVYSPDGNYAIDIFYPITMKTLQSNANIKQVKYKGFHERLYLVVANEDLDQTMLDTFTKTKKLQFTSNITLITIAKLRDEIQRMQTYPNPLLQSQKTSTKD